MEKSKMTVPNGVQVEPPKLPSADLVEFRFNRIDNAIDKLDKKVEFFTQTFLTKEEANIRIGERDEKIANVQKELTALIEDVRKEAVTANKAIKLRIDSAEQDRKWLNRKVLGTVIAAVVTTMVSLFLVILTHSLKFG